MSIRYWLKNIIQSSWFDWLLLLIWIGISTLLRFARLASLPPWTDECATIAFSLGNGFHSVPLNSLIESDVLLQPLTPLPDRGIGAVIEHLMAESTHPPVYFVLAHLWMKLFPAIGGLASIWAARALPALLGVGSIPAMFGLGCLAFRSRLVAHIIAAMMAVSPYGIFLAKDARHYTLAILLVIASLSCLIYTVRAIKNQKILPIGVGLTWVGINSLGIATHYFFTITICSSAIVLLGIAWQESREGWHVLVKPYWRRIYGVAAGTLVGCLVWIGAFQSINGSEPTNWIYNVNPTVEWLAPIGRLAIWIASMVLLLPSAITIIPTWIVVISGLVTIIFLVSILPSLVRGFKLQAQNPDSRLALQVLGGYIVSAIALCFSFTYGLGMDLTLAARFQFVSFPAIIALLGAIMAGVWNSVSPEKIVRQKGEENREIRNKLFLISILIKNGKSVVYLIFLMGFLGGLTVVWNLGYLQNQRADLLVPIIRQGSQYPIVIATTHKHHGQTGRMMGFAWEFKRLGTGNSSARESQFFLAHQEPTTSTYTDGVEVFQKTLSQAQRPLDLWLVDFRGTLDLESQQCFADRRYRGWAGEYKYKLYRCPLLP